MVNLDLLAVNNGLVQFLDGGIRGGLVGHCHKSIALFGDVNISDFATNFLKLFIICYLQNFTNFTST